MLRYSHAERIVLIVLEEQFGDKAVILREQTISKPYGRIFFYQSRKWVETHRTGDGIFGGAPLLVNRFKPELRHITGPGTDLSAWLGRYESGLNPHDLTATPEMPS